MEMRRRIEDSIGFTLELGQMAEIERHCAACESCRAHRERLLLDNSRLSDFAAPRDESIKRVQERAIERVRAAGATESQAAAIEPARPQSPPSRRMLARIPRVAAIAVAAAAVVIAFMVIDLIRGAHNGPVPAFADVQEKMQQVENVVYRVQTWNLGQWTTREEGRSRPHLSRKDFGDHIFVLDIHRGGIAMLLLYPAEKRAVISRTNPSEQHEQCDQFHQRVPNQVDFLATWYKAKDFSFIRKERLNGKSTAVYEKYSKVRGKETNRIMTAWVDLDTELPVRFEMVGSRPDPNSGQYRGLRLSDFQTEDSKRGSWIDLKEGDPVVILDNFRWGASVDTSYFSTVPPAGYSVENCSQADMIMMVYGRGFGNWTYGLDTCKTQGRANSEIISGHLSTWLSLSGNVFPGELEDLGDSTKVNKLLIAKYRRGGDPADEFRSALRVRDDLAGIGAGFGRDMRVREHIDIHYIGKGAVLGDSKRIVFWLKDGNKPPCPDKSGNGPYFMIYGDLHIATSAKPPKSARE
jgi:hypothetical protein